MFVTNFSNDSVSVIDMNKKKQEGIIHTLRGPIAIDLDQFTKRLFIANAIDNTISIINYDPAYHNLAYHNSGFIKKRKSYCGWVLSS